MKQADLLLNRVDTSAENHGEVIARVLEEQRRKKIIRKSMQLKALRSRKALIEKQQEQQENKKRRAGVLRNVVSALMVAMILPLSFGGWSMYQHVMQNETALFSQDEINWKNYVNYVETQGSDIKCAAGQLVTVYGTCHTPTSTRKQQSSAE